MPPPPPPSPPGAGGGASRSGHRASVTYQMRSGAPGSSSRAPSSRSSLVHRLPSVPTPPRRQTVSQLNLPQGHPLDRVFKRDDDTVTMFTWSLGFVDERAERTFQRYFWSRFTGSVKAIWSIAVVLSLVVAFTALGLLGTTAFAACCVALFLPSAVMRAMVERAWFQNHAFGLTFVVSLVFTAFATGFPYVADEGPVDNPITVVCFVSLMHMVTPFFKLPFYAALQFHVLSLALFLVFVLVDGMDNWTLFCAIVLSTLSATVFARELELFVRREFVFGCRLGVENTELRENVGFLERVAAAGSSAGTGMVPLSSDGSGRAADPQINSIPRGLETGVERAILAIKELQKRAESARDKERFKLVMTALTKHRQMLSPAREALTKTQELDETTRQWLLELASTEEFSSKQAARGPTTSAGQQQRDSVAHRRPVSNGESGRIRVPSGSLRELPVMTDADVGKNKGRALGPINEGQATSAPQGSQPSSSDLATMLRGDKPRTSSADMSMGVLPSAAAERASSTIVALTPSEEAELTTILTTHSDWAWDAWRINDLTHGRPLFFVFLYLCQYHDLIEQLGLDEARLRMFLAKIEAGYDTTNPYHNNVHAAEVVLSTHYFLTNAVSKQDAFTYLDIFAALLAAATHDYNHPGTNNAYQVNSSSLYAIRYNDRSVLENYHISAAYEVLLQPSCNMIESLAESDRRYIRRVMIEMILATDMSSHFEILGQFKSKLASNQFDFANNPDDKILLLKIVLKAADIGHTAKAADIHIAWTMRIQEEFYAQGDLERENGLAISPFMDRLTSSIPKSQIGFLSFVVIPLFEVFNHDNDFPRLLEQLRENLALWEERAKEETQMAPVSPHSTHSSARRSQREVQIPSVPAPQPS